MCKSKRTPVHLTPGEVIPGLSVLGESCGMTRAVFINTVWRRCVAAGGNGQLAMGNGHKGGNFWIGCLIVFCVNCVCFSVVLQSVCESACVKVFL